MKTNHIIAFLITFLFTASSCTKEEIEVRNTQITSDLSNPIIQSMTNITWYRNINTTREEWASTENIPKPSEAMATMLYQVAWVNFTLFRDGTSNMLFVPPIFQYAYLHCKGTWQVSRTEENTIIINTKTPIGNATGKIKVLNLETKEQVAIMQISMDLGNRLLTVDFTNTQPNAEPDALEVANVNWIDAQEISTTPLMKDDFIGTWATPQFDRQAFSQEKYPKEYYIRSTYVEDIFSATPNLLGGIAFHFQEGGKALLAYTNVSSQDWSEGKTVTSNASWSVKGNKIIVESDEEYFYSIGELLFGFSVNAPGLTYVGEVYDLPMRTQKKRYYIIEIIKKESHGNWCRITSNNSIFYAFLFKTRLNLDETVDFKEAVRDWEANN